jgi:hypothetical protein
MLKLKNWLSTKTDSPALFLIILATLFITFTIFQFHSIGLILSFVYFSAVLTVTLIVILLIKMTQFLK